MLDTESASWNPRWLHIDSLLEDKVKGRLIPVEHREVGYRNTSYTKDFTHQFNAAHMRYIIPNTGVTMFRGEPRNVMADAPTLIYTVFTLLDATGSDATYGEVIELCDVCGCYRQPTEGSHRIARLQLEVNLATHELTAGPGPGYGL
jgi:hypothetical protein